MSNLYYIKAPCNIYGEKKTLISDIIKKKYDFELEEESFKDFCMDKSTYKILPPQGYFTLTEHIKELKQKKIITVGGDYSLCISTIPQLVKLYNNLEIIFITDTPPCNLIKSYTDINNIILPYLLGEENPIIFDKFNYLKQDQITYFGIDDENYDIDGLIEYNLDFYTKKKINQIGIKEIINIIKEKITTKPIHIVLDLTAFLDNSNISYTLKLIDKLKENVVSMDIVQQNGILDKDIKLIGEFGKESIKTCFSIKENKINIFTEDSPFIIYRLMDQTDVYNDIGWYILRGIDIETRNELLNSLKEDNIISLTIDEEDYLLTKTTISEQNNKSYYTCNKITDTVLFPNEKEAMCFELINL